MNAPAKNAPAKKVAAKPAATSDRVEHETLAHALVAALGSLTDIVKTQTAKVEHKTGGSHTITYADLAASMSHVRPVLLRHGLVITQDVVTVDAGVQIRTTILHESGESRSYGPLTFNGGNNPQATGSAITYARRYSLLAALGLATEDDDGALATAASRTQRAPQTQPARTQQRPAAQPPAVKPWAGPLSVDELDSVSTARHAVVASLNNAAETERAQIKTMFLTEFGSPPNDVIESLVPVSVQWCIDKGLLLVDDNSFLDGWGPNRSAEIAAEKLAAAGLVEPDEPDVDPNEGTE